MFTGIIRELGVIERYEPRGDTARLTITAKEVLEGTQVGDSIAVNGVCLTVEALGGVSFSVTAVEETLAVTNISTWKIGDRLNLENAARFGDPIGGHCVLGHVDTTGMIRRIQKKDSGVELHVKTDPVYACYMIPKGSISCDGISLTLARIERDGFVAAIIPHTLKHTHLHEKNEGDTLNIEFDAQVKTIVHILKTIDLSKIPKVMGEASS